MITKVIINGFQRHQHLVLSLDPAVTTLVGATNMGKSSSLRALKWVMLNKPRGSDFINWDADRVSVTLKVDGHKVTRAKGVEENTYILDGTELGAIGTEVPKTIADVLMVGPENFQDQHDAHFWISETPPEVSRRLNDVVDLTVIDTTLSNLASALRKNDTEIKIVGERLEDANRERRQLRIAKEVHADLLVVEELDARRAQEALQARSLADMAGKALELTDEAQRLGGAYKCGAQVIALGDEWEEKLEQERSLADLISGAHECIGAMTTELPDIKPLEKIADGIEVLEDKCSTIDAMIHDAREMNKAIKFFKKSAIDLAEELETELGEICPLCNQPLK